jgi:hypothetical protein
MTAQKSAFYNRTDEVAAWRSNFRWILLVVDKIVDEVLAASVALSGKQILSVGQSSGQIILIKAFARHDTFWEA